jgi:hypothetical protein
MKTRLTTLAVFATLTVGTTATVDAYNQWSIADDATNCRECHGDFRSSSYVSPVDGQLWGNLHNIHRFDMLDGDCDVCHLDGDTFPVLLDDSAGGVGFASIGCMGCHGVDPGTPNNHWGAGLRLHHTSAGVPPDGDGLTCVSCHNDDPPPQAESVLPSYYFTPDAAHPNKPTDPCNPAPGFPENFAGLTIALDNDGDLLYDQADSDCGTGEVFLDDFESGDTSSWSLTVP